MIQLFDDCRDRLWLGQDFPRTNLSCGPVEDFEVLGLRQREKPLVTTTESVATDLHARLPLPFVTQFDGGQESIGSQRHGGGFGSGTCWLGSLFAGHFHGKGFGRCCGSNAAMHRGEGDFVERLHRSRDDRIQIDMCGTGENSDVVEQPNFPKSTLPKFADFVIFPIRTDGDELAQNSHPPSDIAQPQTDDGQLFLVFADLIDFFLVRIFGNSFRIFPDRADQ